MARDRDETVEGAKALLEHGADPYVATQTTGMMPDYTAVPLRTTSN
jgi:hypothetical protein